MSKSFLADFGINSAVVLSDAIGKATESNWKVNHDHAVPEALVSNSIILSASLFGSIYLFSTSVIGLNKKWIKDEKIVIGPYEVFNGIILGFSSVVMVIMSNKAFVILNKK